MGGPTSVLKVMAKAGFLPVRQAAELACVDATTIYRLIDDGKVEGRRHGRFRFVHAEQLAQLYQEPVRTRIEEALCA